MKLRLAILLPTLLCILGADSLAQAQIREGKTSLPARRDWVRFRVILGRVSVVNAQYGRSINEQSGNPLTGDSETFSINVSAGRPTVRYVLKTESQHLQVDFLRGHHCTVSRQPQNDSGVTAMSYQQPARGPVVLTIGDGQSSRTYREASFWHLMLRYPEPCQKHLLPIFHSLRPGWGLDAVAGRIRTSLLRLARIEKLPDAAECEQLVEQLGNPNFQARRAAERKLKQLGFTVLRQLRDLDPNSLGPEQRMRVERIIDSLQVETDDTPGRIAALLIDDVPLWLILLESDAADDRLQAADHLSKILRREILFDPKADAATRAAQLARLRAQLRGR